MKKVVLAIAVVFALAMSQNIFAQQVPVTANINAKGTVITHITVTSTSDLDFGDDLIAGIATTVDKTASNAGKFVLAGQRNRQMNIAFTLPSNLLNGAYTMPISFTSTDAGFKTSGSQITAFNPASGSNATFGSDGTMEVYLGGKVTPSQTQEAGQYTAPVTITLQYTTN